jgi:tRNA nucleotidyltransferase/poly(A) polymerase
MIKDYKLYKVGGCVRDDLMGIPTKDIDYAFEFNSIDLNSSQSTDHYYLRMNEILDKEGFKILLETPDCFTTKAKFPEGHEYHGLISDFVLCRKEEYLDELSRKPTVSIGNIYDDLARRDFTINAIALDEEGRYLDPHGGIKDLFNSKLKCVISPRVSFREDPLRLMRALRFSITKELIIDSSIEPYLYSYNDFWIKFDTVVSIERVREELTKMFKFNTAKTISLLYNCDDEVISSILGDGKIWLKPTTEIIK